MGEISAVLVLRAWNLVLGLLFAVYLSSALPPDQLGSWFTVLATAAIGQGLLELGIPAEFVRRLAADEGTRLARLTMSGTRLVLPGIAVLWVASVSSPTASLIKRVAIGQGQVSGGLFVGLVVTLLVQRFTAEIARGLHAVTLASILNGPAGRTLALTWMYLSSHLNDDLSLAKAVQIYALSSLCVSLSGMPFIAAIAHRRRRRSPAGEVSAVLLRQTWKIWLSTLLALVVSQGDIVVAGLVLGPEDIGRYGIAWRFAALAALPLQVTNAVIPSRASLLVAQNRLRELENLTAGAASLAFYSSLIIAAGVVLLGPLVIEPLAGPIFIASLPAIAILSIGQVFDVGFGSSGYVLIAARLEEWLLTSTAIAGIASVAGVATLGYQFGLAGAASGSTVAVILSNVVRSEGVKKHLQVNTSGIFRHSPLSALRMINATDVQSSR